jgi:hypothetical protein
MRFVLHGVIHSLSMTNRQPNTILYTHCTGAIIEIDGKKAGKLVGIHEDGEKGLALMKFAQFVNEDGSFSNDKSAALKVCVRDSDLTIGLAGFPVWWDNELTQPAQSA